MTRLSGLVAIENVLPGRYLAFAFVWGEQWRTKLVDVNVTHSKLILLQLKH
ncbi:MAG TPA: hypothetical protein VKU19_05670 [Bryobacteraceae bacterium]|nr:hypothetical protein [Bryobacteraceae bacterium]